MIKSKKVLIAAVVTTLVLVSVAIFSFLVFSSYKQNTLNKNESSILVSQGDTLLKVCRRLVTNNVINDCFGVKVLAKLDSELTQIKTGLFKISPQQSLADLLKNIREGIEVQFSFTILEGENIYQLQKKLSEKKYLVNNLLDLDVKQIAQKLGLKSQSPEGWLYPDTYYYSANSTSEELLKRAVVRQQQVLTELWSSRSEKLQLTTPYQALILASIIEKESSLLSEKETISSVFHNRLKKGMRLQTDPTVIYGVWHEYDGDITRKHLNQKTAYNTYRISGLPPTPIANPSRSSIKAAITPGRTDYYYFVASGDGGHKFNKTLEQHNRAVRSFLRKQRIEKLEAKK